MAIQYTWVTIPKQQVNSNIAPNQGDIYDANPWIGSNIGNLWNIIAKPIVPKASPIEGQVPVSTETPQTQPLPGTAIADTNRPTIPGTTPRPTTIEEDINAQVDKLRAEGRTEEANKLVALKNDYGNWFGLSNGITSIYGWLENTLDWFYSQYAGQMSNTEKENPYLSNVFSVFYETDSEGNLLLDDGVPIPTLQGLTANLSVDLPINLYSGIE